MEKYSQNKIMFLSKEKTTPVSIFNNKGQLFEGYPSQIFSVCISQCVNTNSPFDEDTKSCLTDCYVTNNKTLSLKSILI